MLSASEILSMRAELNLSLPGTAVIKGTVWTTDGALGGSITYSARSTVDARLAPLLRLHEERELAHRIASQTMLTLTLPSGTDISVTDRVVFSEMGTSLTVDVVRVKSPRSYEISTRVICTRVD